MYHRTENFKKDFAQENEMTLLIFNAISNDALIKKPHENIRSLQRLVWHIVVTHAEMLGKAGLVINAPDEDSEPLANIAKICEIYQTSANSVLEQVEKHWLDSSLSTEHEMYGMQWARGTILDVLIKHEIHHRGQLTVIMRLLNLKVPGTYGPSKEDWATYEMPAAE